MAQSSYAAAVKAIPDALCMRERSFSGTPSDLPRWLADLQLHVTGVAGQRMWRVLSEDALSPAGFVESSED